MLSDVYWNDIFDTHVQTFHKHNTCTQLTYLASFELKYILLFWTELPTIVLAMFLCLGIRSPDVLSNLEFRSMSQSVIHF